MIKGTERRIIVVERMDDPYFEKAVFFIRCGAKQNKIKQDLSFYAGEIYNNLISKEENHPLTGEIYPEKKQRKKENGRSFFLKKRNQVGKKEGK